MLYCQIEKYLKNEVALLKDLAHPNLLQFIGATEHAKRKHHIFLLLEINLF